MNRDSALPEFFTALRKQSGGELRSDTYSKILYSTDASIYQKMPLGVYLPRSVEDVHAAVELAAEYKIPLLPRTGGSSLVGQAVNEAVVIDMTRYLDQVLELNSEEMWVRVQPGLVLDELNLYLKPHGLQFGPDPASSNRAAMGGIVANNSTGAHSILYGMTADHVLETKVILSNGQMATFQAFDQPALDAYLRADGLEGEIYRQIWQISQNEADTILAGTPHHWRRCGGYNLDRFVEGATFKVDQDHRFNLAKLISGSEGTLAVMTEIKLNLVPLPTKTALAILHFESLQSALRTVPTILEVGPSAIELLDNLAIRMCRDVPEYARLLTSFVEGEPNCVLITEFYGETEAELTARIQDLKDHLVKNSIHINIVSAIDPDLQQKVWTVRKVGLGLLMSIKGDHKPIPFIEDAAVPVEHLADYVAQVEGFCNGIGTDVAYYAHASAGCLHIRPLINTKEASEVAKLPEITQFSVELLGEYEGSFSSEHGGGRARSWLNEKFYGKDLYALYRQVKHTFDPENILNPGNIIEPAPMTENLRFGSDYGTVQISEHLDFREDLGFNRAVEMCNGAGICRKRTAGTMCPSFMVTREEEHSTRGRANALRAALSGHLPAPELTSKRMFEVMDLCIECKACKAECPSSVDMAKIKFEFLAQYYEKNPVPMRTRLFGNYARWNRLGSGSLAGLANWGAKNSLARWLMAGIFQIGDERQLPEFASQPFTDWFHARQTGGQGVSQAEPVVLFNDTFYTYNYPQVAIAATEVLEAMGLHVQLPGHYCCGRPMISKGLFKEARQLAQDTVARLAPFARAGTPIVGLEPSCVLSFRDEYLYLLPDNEDAALVAENSVTFEEFLAARVETGTLNLEFNEQDIKILLHGHCHQKSLVGTGPAETLLRSPGGYQVEVVDSGCCGMAGSFGYEAEHYETSMMMAERRLLPAVREVPEDTIIAAAGVSCRQQIQHGAGKTAQHPAEIIRTALRT